MKKLLSGIVAIVLMLALATNVNAATLAVNSSSVQQGGNITVTIMLKDPSSSVGFALKYDTSKVTFVSATTGLGMEDANDNGGVVTIGGFDTSKTTKSITFNFTAKETEGSIGSAEFSVVDNTTEGESTPAAMSVNVTAKAGQPEQGGSSTETEGGSSTGASKNNDTTKKNEAGSKYKDDEGNDINSIPQTGTSYVAIAGIALLAIAGIVVYKKNK